jgi:hypothetical protein
VITKSVERVPDLDETLMAYCMDDQLMRRRIANIFDSSMTPKLTAEAAELTASGSQHLAADGFVRQLRKQRDRLTGRPRAHLMNQWYLLLGSTEMGVEVPVVVPGEVPSTRGKAAETMHLLGAEMEFVRTEAQKRIEKLRKLPGTMVGVQILEMFVLDLMGRQSPQAKLFVNQRTSVSVKIVTSMWLKGLAVVLLVVLNVYFIIMCIAYGDLKGRKWQVSWMLSCLAYLFVDIFIKHVNIVFMVYYYIPELIEADTISMKERLTKAIDSFVKNSYGNRSKGSEKVMISDQSPQEVGEFNSDVHSKLRHGAVVRNEQKFSVTDHLFVSTHVARAFPNLLESSIVLAYRSLVVSPHQAQVLQLSSVEDSQQAKLISPFPTNDSDPPVRSETNDESIYSRWFIACRMRTMISVVSLTLANTLVTLGCQHIVLQKMVVQMLDPLIMGAAAFLGSLIIKHTMIGVPIVVSIAFICAGLIYWWYRRRIVVKKLSRGSESASSRVQPVPLATAEEVRSDASIDSCSDRDGERSSLKALSRGHSELDMSTLKALNPTTLPGLLDAEDVDDFDSFDDEFDEEQLRTPEIVGPVGRNDSPGVNGVGIDLSADSFDEQDEEFSENCQYYEPQDNFMEEKLHMPFVRMDVIGRAGLQDEIVHEAEFAHGEANEDVSTESENREETEGKVGKGDEDEDFDDSYDDEDVDSSGFDEFDDDEF